MDRSLVDDLRIQLSYNTFNINSDLLHAYQQILYINEDYNENERKEIFIPDDCWSLVFYYVRNTKDLLRVGTVSRRFRKIVTKDNHIWNFALTSVLLDFRILVPNDLRVKEDERIKTSSPSNYSMCVAYGAYLASYLDLQKTLLHNSLQKEKKKKIRNYKGIMLVLLLYALFIISGLVIGLQIDNIISLPVWMVALPIIGLCFSILVLITLEIRGRVVHYKSNKAIKAIKSIINCTPMLLSSLFIFFSFLLALPFVYIAYHYLGETTTLQKAIWAVAGAAIVLFIYIMLSLPCDSELESARYGPGFRLCFFVCFTVFVVGIILYLYPLVYDTSYRMQDFGSMFTFNAYLFFFGFIVCSGIFGITTRVSFAEIFSMGMLECLLAGTFAIPVILFQVYYDYNILLSLVLLPLYSFPLFLCLWCRLSRRNAEKWRDTNIV